VDCPAWRFWLSISLTPAADGCAWDLPAANSKRKIDTTNFMDFSVL